MKNKYDRHEPKTTTELQTTDYGQTHTECGFVSGQVYYGPLVK